MVSQHSLELSTQLFRVQSCSHVKVPETSGLLETDDPGTIEKVH
jgi:hypothetical protein